MDTERLMELAEAAKAGGITKAGQEFQIAALAAISDLIAANKDLSEKLTRVTDHRTWPDVTEYVRDYDLRGDGDYTPNDFERVLIEDAICGYTSELNDMQRKAASLSATGSAS